MTLHLFEQFNAGHDRHLDVGQHRIDRTVTLQPLNRFTTVAEGENGVVIFGKQSSNIFKHIRIIINDKNSIRALLGHHAFPAVSLVIISALYHNVFRQRTLRIAKNRAVRYH